MHISKTPMFLECSEKHGKKYATNNPRLSDIILHYNCRKSKQPLSYLYKNCIYIY